MFSKNYKQFSVIYNENKYLYQDVLDITDQIKGIFNGRHLIILTAENDLVSLSVYLRSIQSRVPIMLLSNKLDSSELDVIVNKFKPSYLISSRNLFNFCTNKPTKRILENYYLYEFAQFSSVKIN